MLDDAYIVTHVHVSQWFCLMLIERKREQAKEREKSEQERYQVQKIHKYVLLFKKRKT